MQKVRGLLLPWKSNWTLWEDQVKTALESGIDKTTAKNLRKKSGDLGCFAKVLRFFGYILKAARSGKRLSIVTVLYKTKLMWNSPK